MPSTASNVDIIRNEIRRQRTWRKQPPRKVVAKVHRILNQQGCDVEEVSGITVDWLKRLEIGRSARITPEILNALLQALDFSPYQRCRLMTLAGYSPLPMVDPTLASVAEGLNYVAYILLKHPLAAQVMAAGFQELERRNATDDEWIEIVASGIKLIRDYHRRH